MIWSAVLPSPVVSIILPSMLGLIIITLFAGFLGIFTYDFFTKKKTEVNGAHVVITGGSSGIGKALAIKLAKCGANITILARNMVRLEETLKEVKKHLAPERKVLALSVDLSGEAQDVGNTLDQACETLGPIDILINCAGFAVCGLFEETSVEDFKAMINTNYLASVFTSHAVVEKMKQRRKGHIVFVSSIGGQFGIFGFTAYSPSKFAVRGFAETLFMEVKPYNVAVSVVFPPDTDTPGFENENKNKPEETHLISSSGGLFTSEQVAANIVTGIEERRFSISCGFDGFVVGLLTSGVSPVSSLFELFTQLVMWLILDGVSLAWDIGLNRLHLLVVIFLFPYLRDRREGLSQVILMGPLRLVLALYLHYYDRIVMKGMLKRQANKKAN